MREILFQFLFGFYKVESLTSFSATAGSTVDVGVLARVTAVSPAPPDVQKLSNLRLLLYHQSSIIITPPITNWFPLGEI